MSDTAYFEVSVEGDESKVIDLSQYAQGRSGRALPSSLSLTLQAYRYRPATATCALFPPRLIAYARNIFSAAENAIEGEAGSRRAGASVGLIGRTSDTGSSCVDSVLAGFSFEIPVTDSIPPSIEISVADGGVTPQVVGYAKTATGAPDKTKPIRGTGTAEFEARMSVAIGQNRVDQLNAIRVPIAIGKKLLSPTPPSPDAIEAQIYGDVPEVDEGYFLDAHHHIVDDAAFSSSDLVSSDLVKRSGIYFLRTTATNPTAGVKLWVVAFTDQSNSWVGDLMQKGSALAFFYNVAVGGLTIPQRIDVLVGNLTSPGDASFPKSLIGETIRPFVSVWECRFLPLMEPLVTPPTVSVITRAACLPIRRREGGLFAGTFTLDFAY